ncbi:MULTISPECIES: FAD-dependent oxidoreductase [Lactobacillaceae]|uniref:Putative NADH oxidase (Putative) n=1 Tax=Loigolactobacillus coryniformis subsp. coryniformis KCTC 3167 = DSM 20001 TaxID=913848 RepID=A0A0R1F9R1_9LACO|nr:FAD-dependent oxidoreductase [Loigolactobacillus coryniformis]ATO54781.1 CoA-disulfide reductase [Loigolactobacillus coryniformis subsp. coryniformis KCTC 3167 = DSM 20001]KRK18422.1 putative NADH oxidase (putative) [Loigolactobacillus coryniformis subsp. coryniformis KCTC 3167 = DSM 20001]MCL5459475.1 FAD-dependent oxidoreductase [Loigolactobacillus coryniformis]OEH89814.1 CoA-disulfide reductase [Loigolactobacillus coryniformis subsp. coryniformis]
MANKAEKLLIIGGSDAGVSAALKAKELKPELEVQVLLADEYPNLSICGLPYAISGEVANWRSLAHRGLKELTATGVKFQMNMIAEKIDSQQHEVVVHSLSGELKVYHYNHLVVATGAKPKLSHIKGVDLSRTQQSRKVHVLHTMADYFAIEKNLATNDTQEVAIVGSGYIGIEMAEALKKRQLDVTIFQRSTEILSTVDADLGQIVHRKLSMNSVNVVTGLTVSEINENNRNVEVIGLNERHKSEAYKFDLVLIVVGVQPNAELLIKAGATTGIAGAIKVDQYMHTSLPDIWAAGDLVETKHHLLGETYLPLGTTAHKQGRTAGFNIAGIQRAFKGSIGTQVLKVFDLVVARAGLLASEAIHAGFDPLTVTTVVDDHKAYFPGSQKIRIRITGDKKTGRLLGVQLIGHYGSEVAKRSDIFATAIFNDMTVAEISDLDLSYSPPVGSPWDAVQIAAQNWEQQNTKYLLPLNRKPV